MEIKSAILLIASFHFVLCRDADYDKLNGELLKLNQINAIIEWESAIEPSPNVSHFKKQFYKMQAKWREKWCEKLEAREDFVTDFFCRGPKYSTEQASLVSLISDKLMRNYEAEVCDNNRTCLRAEPELERLMATSRDEEILDWAWTTWRNKMSAVKPIFMELIALENAAAKQNGYDNVGDIWREEIGISNVESTMDNMWSSVEELYRLLHAVVRFKLGKIYSEIVDPTSPIPAHLLGDLWSQNWVALVDLLIPESHTILNLTKSLTAKNYDVLEMIVKAEDFYVSLGFPPLPHQFWENSIFTGNHSNCHGMAANMYKIGDVRILGCFQVSEKDFRVIYHELGHVYYYMAYEAQDPIFRNGINSAFHESIGDAILLGVMTPQHLQRLGLADDAILTDDMSILVKEALIKLPLIASALALEKWRFRILEGNFEATKVNDLWWKIHGDIMGIAPPKPRPDFFFDPAAKFHVIANIPYSRYFFATFLQFQIFDSMCQTAVTGKINNINFTLPLHTCDIYGSKESTKRLRALMKLGSTLDISGALEQLTDIPKMRIEPLINYFSPVYNFLRSEIDRFNIAVGWS